MKKRSTRRKVVNTKPIAKMVLTTRDGSKDRVIYLEDAKRLYEEHKIVELFGMGGYLRAFGMPYITDDIIYDRTIPFNKEVLDCISKAEREGAKF